MCFINKIENEDLTICENAGSFLQSAMWGEFKSKFDWKCCSFVIKWEGYGDIPLLLLYRRLLPGFSFAYIPWGPELPCNFPEGNREKALGELAKKLKSNLPKNTAFIRFDPPWHKEDYNFHDSKKIFAKAGLKQAAASVQPPDTVHISLDSSLENILSAMKPKWRYNISLAAKKGVDVRSYGENEVKDALNVFYSLLKETAARDGIAIHGINYYETLFEHIRKRSSGRQKNGNDSKLRLYIASHQGDALASIAVLLRKETATYLYGASSNIKRNLMAAYALQWKAMQDAKDSGCRIYDLFGIPPDDNPSHPMAGLYRFKTGFGGKIIHRPGSWDYIYKPAIYSLFNFAESWRKKLRDRKKKR